MGNGWRKAAHVLSAIESSKNTILTLQSISLAMLDLNHPAEDALVTSQTSVLDWNFQAHRIILLKYFNFVDFIVPFLHGKDLFVGYLQ